MGSRDKRVDSYISKAQVFAQPILAHLRELVHTACPDVEETIKWGFPNFIYCGSILCSMAAFKQHCSFGFWKASLMPDPENIIDSPGKTGMGHLGKIFGMSDIPSDAILKKYIKLAAKLNKEDIKLPPKKKAVIVDLAVPDFFKKALDKNKKASQAFEALSPSHKKEYVEWLTEAKTESTRDKRLLTALEWIAEGKGRNWRYQKK